MNYVEKYVPNEVKKKVGNKLLSSSMTAVSNDNQYNDDMITEGGVGIDATMKYVMDTELGNPTTPLQMFHGTTSSGMQLFKPTY
jgi:hypothetical protein